VSAGFNCRRHLSARRGPSPTAALWVIRSSRFVQRLWVSATVRALLLSVRDVQGQRSVRGRSRGGRPC
jgi:hypothetical protein